MEQGWFWNLALLPLRQGMAVSSGSSADKIYKSFRPRQCVIALRAKSEAHTS